MCGMPEEFTKLKNECAIKATLFGCPENVLLSIGYSTCLSDLFDSVGLTNNNYFKKWMEKELNKIRERNEQNEEF